MGVSKNPKVSDQDTAIAKIYDSLVHDLGEGQAATRGIFDRGNTAMAGSYQGAADQLAGTQGAITGRLASQLGGMGLGAALPEVLNPITSQGAFDQGQIAKERATNLGSLSKQGTQYEAIGQVGIGNAQKEKAQTRADALRSLEELLAQLQAENEQARTAGELELAKIRAQARAASGGGETDPLMALKAQQMGLENQKLEQELMGGGEPVEYHGGQRGLHEFLNSPSAYWGDGGADAATRARINDIISGASKRAGLGEFDSFTSGGQSYRRGDLTPQDIAMIGVGSTKEAGINKEALRMALQLYYGK